MKEDSGEIVVGLLVGLAIGVAMLVVNAGNKAQMRANATGREVSPFEVAAEDPGQSALTILGPAVAGAGVGWALDKIGGDNSTGNTSVNVNENEGNVSINVGNATSTRTDTTTTDNSERK